MSEVPKKKIGFFTAIKSRDDALQVIKDVSMGFFFVAALQAAVALASSIFLLFDAVAFAFCAYFLRRYNSRGASVFLLAMTAVGAVITFGNKMGANFGGGSNVFLSIIVLWAAIRAVDASFKLHGKFAVKAEPDEAPGA